jgi:hypothetical protein
LWLLVASPFVLLAAATGNSGDWIELAQGILSFAALTYAVLLSFLVLAFANGGIASGSKRCSDLATPTRPHQHRHWLSYTPRRVPTATLTLNPVNAHLSTTQVVTARRRL